jgi:hypothetical protein
MELLSKNYEEKLKIIAGAIQDSDLLSNFLLEEGEEEYKQLIEAFEPAIAEFYDEVAANNPLQIIDLENKLSEADFEGLFLPRMLGFSVLRGVVDDQYKYLRPQDHFKDLLNKMCHHANFEMIKARVGQTLQVGFALSSDIWITNFIETISNKKIKTFLLAQKLDKYRTVEGRKTGYLKYKRQFDNYVFHCFEMPSSVAELKSSFPAVETFLQVRLRKSLNNETVKPIFFEMLSIKEISEAVEYPKLLLLAGKYFELEEEEQAQLKAYFQAAAKIPYFNERYFEYLRDLLIKGEPVNFLADVNMLEVLGEEDTSEIGHYYATCAVLYIDNLLEEEIIDSVRAFYAKYDGLSLNNECLRLNVLRHFQQSFQELTPEEYSRWFELNKIFAAYMEIFQNQRFNLAIKDFSVKYLKSLLKFYTDKRGKDYQDIKKFSTRIFLDYNFFKDKEIKEFFKTPRAKKSAGQ